MTASMYYKCKICGCICNLKYQMGYSRKHPIRYRCKCGVSMRGSFEKGKGISFENAVEAEDKMPEFVVYCSGEFFTVPPFAVNSYEETIASVPPPFILATQLLDYDNYVKEFQHILSYRDVRHPYVRAINELYAAGNIEKIKDIIRKQFDPKEELFPLNNSADYLRATTMINQFQFLDYDGTRRTPKTDKIILLAFKQHTEQCNEFLKYIESTNKLEIWKAQIHNISDQVYDKIDLLMPAVAVDFVKDKDKFDINFFAITTTIFEEIKQLYVDLYELIGSLLVLAIGIDNILQRDDYKAIKEIHGLDVHNLHAVMKMRNKGNIIKLIDETAPIESLLCKSLNSDVRNSIGHYSYVSYEIADSYGQHIEFKDPNNQEKSETKSLLQVCYDIWQMYKTLGIFNELIHHFEIQLLGLNGVCPSFITDPVLFQKMVVRPNSRKIYPNEQCPCGSGLKYKKCCGQKT